MLKKLAGNQNHACRSVMKTLLLKSKPETGQTNVPRWTLSVISVIDKLYHKRK